MVLGFCATGGVREGGSAVDRGALACLSREVMERVLAFLPAPWLVHVAPLVSRDFYFLARSNALWKPLYEARWRAGLNGAGGSCRWGERV